MVEESIAKVVAFILKMGSLTVVQDITKKLPVNSPTKTDIELTLFPLDTEDKNTL